MGKWECDDGALAWQALKWLVVAGDTGAEQGAWRAEGADASTWRPHFPESCSTQVSPERGKTWVSRADAEGALAQPLVPRTQPGKVDKNFFTRREGWVAGIFETCPVSQTALSLRPGGPGILGLPADRKPYHSQSKVFSGLACSTTRSQQGRTWFTGNPAPCLGPQFLQLHSKEAGQGHSWAHGVPTVPKDPESPLCDWFLMAESSNVHWSPPVAEKGCFPLDFSQGAPAGLWNGRWPPLAPA